MTTNNSNDMDLPASSLEIETKKPFQCKRCGQKRSSHVRFQDQVNEVMETERSYFDNALLDFGLILVKEVRGCPKCGARLKPPSVAGVDSENLQELTNTATDVEHPGSSSKDKDNDTQHQTPSNISNNQDQVLSGSSTEEDEIQPQALSENHGVVEQRLAFLENSLDRPQRKSQSTSSNEQDALPELSDTK